MRDARAVDRDARGPDRVGQRVSARRRVPRRGRAAATTTSVGRPAEPTHRTTIGTRRANARLLAEGVRDPMPAAAGATLWEPDATLVRTDLLAAYPIEPGRPVGALAARARATAATAGIETRRRRSRSAPRPPTRRSSGRRRSCAPARPRPTWPARPVPGRCAARLLAGRRSLRELYAWPLALWALVPLLIGWSGTFPALVRTVDVRRRPSASPRSARWSASRLVHGVGLHPVHEVRAAAYDAPGSLLALPSAITRRDPTPTHPHTRATAAVVRARVHARDDDAAPRTGRRRPTPAPNFAAGAAVVEHRVALDVRDPRRSASGAGTAPCTASRSTCRRRRRDRGTHRGSLPVGCAVVGRFGGSRPGAAGDDRRRSHTAGAARLDDATRSSRTAGSRTRPATSSGCRCASIPRSGSRGSARCSTPPRARPRLRRRARSGRSAHLPTRARPAARPDVGLPVPDGARRRRLDRRGEHPRARPARSPTTRHLERIDATRHSRIGDVVVTSWVPADQRARRRHRQLRRSRSDTACSSRTGSGTIVADGSSCASRPAATRTRSARSGRCRATDLAAPDRLEGPAGRRHRSAGLGVHRPYAPACSRRECRRSPAAFARRGARASASRPAIALTARA